MPCSRLVFPASFAHRPPLEFLVFDLHPLTILGIGIVSVLGLIIFARLNAFLVETSEWLCESAWTKFEAGDQEGYLEEIARFLPEVAPKGEVIVLAQASMAPAMDLCAGLSTPVLSSPRLGVEAALKAYRVIH
jgi:hypothetical protein